MGEKEGDTQIFSRFLRFFADPRVLAKLPQIDLSHMQLEKELRPIALGFIYLIIGGAVLNLSLLCGVYFFGVLEAQKPRFFAGLFNAVIAFVVCRITKPHIFLRIGLVVSGVATCYRALSLLHADNLLTFTGVYMHLNISGTLLTTLFLSPIEAACSILLCLALTFALPFLYPHVPSHVFGDLGYTILSIQMVVIFAVVVISSQKKTLARQREEVEKARVLAVELAQLRAQFLAAMSHEVRTPLNGILGLTSVLLDGALLPGQRELLEVCVITVH